ncbi:NAD(P)H-dependent oxidoreductase [Paenibacillus luteus]|uniref:NAD(P)H-dependent oxidoreductase n=1 Tax=Paenibacillus luteus TaxID=2545753 RepID=UPI001F4FA336|nr:NAD(P)H-dependent oxidoreductase [Paenibacillus luteus]
MDDYQNEMLLQMQAQTIREDVIILGCISEDIERVFTYGFAYKYVNGEQMGLLQGKKAVIIHTQGKSNEEYAASGLDQALRLT